MTRKPSFDISGLAVLNGQELTVNFRIVAECGEITSGLVLAESALSVTGLGSVGDQISMSLANSTYSIEVCMATIKFRNQGIAFSEEGAGPVVMMLHGGGSSGAQWKKSADDLSSECRSVMPDLWGFGQSEIWNQTTALSHSDQSDLVKAVVTAVAAEKVHLVGHSYGGTVAVRFALTFPNLVKSLVLIEPVLMPLLKQTGDETLFDEYFSAANGFLQYCKDEQFDQAWQLFIDYHNGAGAWDQMPEKAKTRISQRTIGTVAAFEAILNDSTTIGELGQIAVPSLVIAGEDTTAPYRRVAESLNKRTTGSVFQTVPGGGHMTPLTHPDQIAQAVRTHCLSH